MPTDATGREHVTAVKIKDTSATERATFRKCRRRWLLTTVHRLTNVEGDQNLWLGTLVHAGLEEYYRELKNTGWTAALPRRRRDELHDAAVGMALAKFEQEYEESLVPLKDALTFLWPNVEPTYRALGELGFDMVQYYFDRERDDPIFDEILDVERRVFVAIRAPGGRRVASLSVKADIVGRKDGVLAVGDHKTASREMSSTQLDLDDQLTAEVYAVWEDRGREEFPEEAVYNVLMKKVPRPPKENKPKKGVRQLSKDKSQPTTYQIYYDEVKRLDLNVADYADVLDYLRAQEVAGESQFFKRERVLRSTAQIASFEANLYQEWRDMSAVARHPERAYPNPSPFNCPACPVRLVCLTMQDDGDVEAIIKATYVVGDPRR